MAFLGAVICLVAVNSHAFTVSLLEQGNLTGFVVGGGGTVTINPIAADHWSVTVTDPRIGNAVGLPFNLAFTEPETVFGLTAYNNLQVFSMSPGVLTFDVLSDEFSPYSTVVPNMATAPFQNTDIDLVSIKFTDIADSAPEPGTATLFLAGVAVILLKRFHPGRSVRQIP